MKHLISPSRTQRSTRTVELVQAAPARNKRRLTPTKRTRRAMLITTGASLLGGILPAISYDVAHRQAPDLFTQPWSAHHGLWLIVAGLLVYSSFSVQSFMARYVGNLKAWGFVIGIETAATCTDHWTAIPALLALCVINAVVLGHRMSQD